MAQDVAFESSSQIYFCDFFVSNTKWFENSFARMQTSTVLKFIALRQEKIKLSNYIE